MAKLLDLPPEILELILGELGGRNLRRDVSNLTMCWKWYEAAHAIYLSGLDKSQIEVHGCDVEDMINIAERDWFLMHKNTRELHVRLVGHWWDSQSKYILEDSDADDGLNEPPSDFGTPDGRKALIQWQSTILNPALKGIFEGLGQFDVLERVALEALLDISEEVGPQNEYLNSSTVAALLRNLPLAHHLRHLTLDLCSGVNYWETNEAHLCEEIAPILYRLESVRLRLKLICPSIFDTPSPPSDAVRLKSLVIKLHLPMFGSTTHFTSRCCHTIQGARNSTRLHEYIIKEAKNYSRALSAAAEEHVRVPTGQFETPQLEINASSPFELDLPERGMNVFRVSCVALSHPDIYTVDVLTMRKLFIGSEFFAYEDDGTPCWFEDDPEEAERLLDGGPFVFNDRSN